MPSPLVELPCGSVSMMRISFSASARQAPRFIAVVVFPTPPFWFTMAMTVAIAVILTEFTVAGQGKEKVKVEAKVKVKRKEPNEESRQIRTSFDE